MDLLDSAMELLNNTSSPTISSGGSNISSTTSHGESLYQLQSANANNLVQEAMAMASAAEGVDGIGGGGDVSGLEVVSQPQQTLEDAFLPRYALKSPRSSSSSESESEEATNPTAGTSADGNGERVASPPPNCAICLGRCKNKCFTDSCMHQFCFKCLCEWSKVKPECPLCKQTFKSIIHNVKSEHQFEEYHVQPPTVQIAQSQFDMDLAQMRIFGVVSQNIGRNETWSDRVNPNFMYAIAPTAAGGGNNNRSMPVGSLRNQYMYRAELLDLYRQEYPDSTLSQLWRRYVYDRKLYALPVRDVTGRFRESSSQYYRDNPAQIHRLMPWISRDLQCLLRQSQHDVNTVLESINSALVLMNILSPAFRRRLQTYLGNKTAHFIHELNNFARSPFDMIGYDRVVEYSPQSSEDVVIEFTSSDDTTDTDEIDVAEDSATQSVAASTNGGTLDNDDVENLPSYYRVFNTHFNSFTAINLTIHNRLASNMTRHGGDGTAGPSGSMRSVVQDGVSLVIDLRNEPEETTATDAAVHGNNSTEAVSSNLSQPTVTENIELTSGSSDECEFVLERKPPHLRTPEKVSLDSASDSDVVFVEETKPLNKTSFSTSEAEPDNDDADTGKVKRQSSNRSKITALVEAKKRNQQSATSTTKNDATPNNSDIYNVGASTSAALRLSIQQNKKRTKYSLRNARADTNQVNPTRRRGKRLPSESSHSSSSDSSLGDGATSGSSSDEEYVLSANQRHSAKKRRRVKKSKRRRSKCGTSATKRRKTNNNYESTDDDPEESEDDDDDDEDDNGHMGKNFALVMALNGRLKRQEEKLKTLRATNIDDEENQSEGENSWRVKAVNEPLRKQQQQQAKSALIGNGRKRRIRKLSHKSTNDENIKQPKLDDDETQGGSDTHGKEEPAFKNCESSGESSESDNVKLIELKTKLSKNSTSNENLESTSNERLHDEDANRVTSSSNDPQDKCTETAIASPRLPYAQESLHITACDDNAASNMPTVVVSALETQTHSSYDDDTVAIAAGCSHPHTTGSEAKTAPVDDIQGENSGENSENQDKSVNFKNPVDDIKKEMEEIEHEGDTEHARREANEDNEYSNETSNLYSTTEHDEEQEDIKQEREEGEEEDDDDDEEDDVDENGTTLNENMSHDSNVFDANSMSNTTTTDTILNEAAEQISPAAVSFYTPQPQSSSFNTADFADDNTMNSSSSESSVSSTTTSSSSSSSSNNTNDFMNYLS
ncbi:E3 ubiquitin-protein ligase Topors-like isoform X1 [Musca domestica]|uniref:E3 ubiquitin-protein ligase Topors n=1 Tax=Musca domestica TaxID=7370 RepID=A0A1I8M6B6_MUSDO|nr:E3 ubiquitin-protein ligase Topors-like isoform X1 [Musca domestica]XP_058981979.1 E3 ubiquitin-protein ligase Topors-like isoform X1 [Musca domestica]